MKPDNLITAALIAALAAMVCFFAARYELAKLGIATGQRWWPPRDWGAVQVWRGVRSVQGPKASLWFWTIMLWLYWLIALALFPVVVYFVYLGFR
jgi:hypothetical protein